MNTSQEALARLQKASEALQDAQSVIDNLIAPHDYQDVASKVVEAAGILLSAATMLMESQDESALTQIENAEDLLDAVYDIIEGELDE